MARLVTIDFDPGRIALSPCYANEELLGKIARETPDKGSLPKVDEVMGALVFSPAPARRPYVFSSIVLSADGKMAYADNRSGPVIARNNFFDTDGALADFWVLNALRACSDGVVIGARTLSAEPDATSHVYDPVLASQRAEILGKSSHPVSVIVSFDGTDIPLDHLFFQVEAGEGLPLAIATSPVGARFLSGKLGLPVDEYANCASGEDVDRLLATRPLSFAPGRVVLISTGSGSKPDSAVLLYLLRRAGMERLLVESPTYTSHLMLSQSLDEYFVNYSMVYAGGTLTPGYGAPLPSVGHPHALLLRVAMHKASFLYTRQKLYYGVASVPDLAGLKY